MGGGEFRGEHVLSFREQLLLVVVERRSSYCCWWSRHITFGIISSTRTPIYFATAADWWAAGARRALDRCPYGAGQAEEILRADAEFRLARRDRRADDARAADRLLVRFAKFTRRSATPWQRRSAVRHRTHDRRAGGCSRSALQRPYATTINAPVDGIVTKLDVDVGFVVANAPKARTDFAGLDQRSFRFVADLGNGCGRCADISPRRFHRGARDNGPRSGVQGTNP